MAILRDVIFYMLLFYNYCYAMPNEDSSTLQQLHVIFRHGDRAPDQSRLYPKDPHLNDTWYPEGYGQLTLQGKKRVYNIGTSLRNLYNTFLGDIYTPGILDAWSTDYNRTKMSCELVLAGLWPPKHHVQEWNNKIPWQPIPYNYLPKETDTLLRFPYEYCPKYRAIYAAVVQLPKFQNFLINNSDLIKYINEHTGLNIKTTVDLFELYYGLYAEENTGRTLPDWTKKIYPEFLENATILDYELQTYNDFMLRYSGGYMVQKIINDAKAKIDDNLVPENRKLFLYSGHEYNIVHILAALHLFQPHVPNYGAYILIELHKIDDQYGFKFFYQNYAKEMPQLLIIPGCESICSFEKFIKLTAGVLPEPEC